MSPALAGVRMHVITVSDRSAAGERPDTSGPLLAEAFGAMGADVTRSVIADGITDVRNAIDTATTAGARIIVTTGGTGLSPRDLTPEATAPLVERHLPGIAERLRAVDSATVPTSALSRGIAGVTAAGVIVVNVAGSAGAARSAAFVLGAILPHALTQLAGEDH